MLLYSSKKSILTLVDSLHNKYNLFIIFQYNELYMQKDFDQWNIEKKKIDRYTLNIQYKEEEIWWCSVGLNIGIESCGKGQYFRRPVLIMRKLSQTSFIGIPLTTQLKQGTWFQEIKHNGKGACAILSQVRLFDSHRLQRRIGTLDKQDFTEVKNKLKTLLKL